ncbi:hypothetical protein ABTG52_07370 [Acinetobacter baumannii]
METGQSFFRSSIIFAFVKNGCLDAMTPYGFSGLRVRQTVRQLLKEYGGNEGWPFIEAYAYKELIDAILRDGQASNGHMESVEGQNSSKPEEEGGDVSGTSVAITGEKDIQEPELPSAPSNVACPEMDVEVEVEVEVERRRI